jgi:hypothetical protein
MQVFDSDAKIFLEKKFQKIWPQKVEKNHLKKFLTYGSWEVFFSAALTVQNFISVLQIILFNHLV